MKDIKKGILLALGFASLAKEKMDREVRKLVKSGHLTQKQARATAFKILKKANEQRKVLEKFVAAETRKIEKRGRSVAKRALAPARKKKKAKKRRKKKR